MTERKQQRSLILFHRAVLFAATVKEVALAEADADEHYSSPHDGDDGDTQHGSHPVTAILFPWFSEIVGVLTFFVLSVSLLVGI